MNPLVLLWLLHQWGKGSSSSSPRYPSPRHPPPRHPAPIPPPAHGAASPPGEHIKAPGDTVALLHQGQSYVITFPAHPGDAGRSVADKVLVTLGGTWSKTRLVMRDAKTWQWSGTLATATHKSDPIPSSWTIRMVSPLHAAVPRIP